MAQFGEDFTLFTSTGMLCVIFLSWYAYWHIRRRHMLELAERIPGPKGLPLIGSMLEFTGNPHGNMQSINLRSSIVFKLESF